MASFNDCLLVGPPFLNDLCSILLRFRIPTFAFATDIEKTLLHMKLHNSDMDYTHFLWLSDITNPTGDLATYSSSSIKTDNVIVRPSFNSLCI